MEGRSRLASNVNPLWSAMPEGALKRQLLGEIADLVQLSTRELTEIWDVASAAKLPPSKSKYSNNSNGREGSNYRSNYSVDSNNGFKSEKTYNADGSPVEPKNYYKNNSTPGSKYAGSGQFSGGKFGSKFGTQFGSKEGVSRVHGRVQPTVRADHAARLLLSATSLWDAMSHDDHAMLCEQPAPAGALFVWLEAQLHDHGALPWGALREGLRGADLESFALKLMSEVQKKDDLTAESNSQDAIREAQQELRALLNRMHIDRLKALETEVIEAAKADPTQLAKYKDIVERRKKLEASLVPTA
jgi:DNA primase